MLDGLEIAVTALNLVPESATHRLDAVPISFNDEGSLVVAMVDPRNLLAIADLAMLTGRTIVPVVVTRERPRRSAWRTSGASGSWVEGPPAQPAIPSPADPRAGHYKRCTTPC